MLTSILLRALMLARRTLIDERPAERRAECRTECRTECQWIRARTIAATHPDLTAVVAHSEFRADLCFGLAVDQLALTLAETIQVAIGAAFAAEGGDARAAARRFGASRATIYRSSGRGPAGAMP